MADEDNVLFVRGHENKSTTTDDEDVWDDTALIKAYDKAVNLAKEEVAKRIGMEVPTSEPEQKPQNFKQSRKTNKQRKKWTIGAPCRAVYSEDGEIYEAIVSKVYENTGTCIVKFVGYGNTEKVQLSSLLESEGLQSQIAQQRNAWSEKFTDENVETAATNSSPSGRKYNGGFGENMDFETEELKSYKNNFMPGPSFNSTMDMMPPAPPLPPQFIAKLPENDADALSSMLMSWYISGYHTGYYHGLKQGRGSQEKRKNC